MKTDTRDRLAELLGRIAPEMDLEDVEPDEDLREALDIDSFDYLRLMAAIEKELGVTVPEADYPQLQTLEGAIRYLETRR